MMIDYQGSASKLKLEKKVRTSYMQRN